MIKKSLVLILPVILASCSSVSSKRIKSVTFKKSFKKNVTKHKETKFESCKWDIQYTNLSMPYDNMLINDIVDSKVVRAENLFIENSGIGFSGVGRYCKTIKGDFYVTK